VRWIIAAVVTGVGILIVVLLSVLAVAILAERSTDQLRTDLAQTVEPFALNLERLRVAVHRTSGESRAYALTVDPASRARYESARAELALVEEELLLDAAGTPYELAARDAAALAGAHTSVADAVVEHVDNGDLLGAMRLVIDDTPPLLQDFEFATSALRTDVAMEADRLRGEIAEANDRQELVLFTVAGVGVATVLALALLAAGLVRAMDTSRSELARSGATAAAPGRAMYELDARGRITHLNAAAEEMLGYTPGELRGRDEHASIHRTRREGSTLPREECRILGSLADGDPYAGTEAFTRKDGTVLSVEVSSVPVLVDGRAHGAIVAFTSTTSHLRDERRDDDVLTFASHELRGPLTTVYGFARFLRKRMRDEPTALPGDVREAIEGLETETTRMDGLIETLLDLARIDSDRLILTRSEVDVRHLVGKAVERLLVRHPSSVVTLDAPATPVRAYTDETRVRQMLASLLDNAARYGGRPPHVDVRLTADTAAVTIAIRDDGPGIPQEEHQHVFGRFYRANGSTREVGRGLGLGLYLTKELARALGGDVDFTTSHGGSEFCLTLPLASGEPGTKSVSPG
jgi:PAS domain S-box-containing protein